MVVDLVFCNITLIHHRHAVLHVRIDLVVAGIFVYAEEISRIFNANSDTSTEYHPILDRHDAAIVISMHAGMLYAPMVSGFLPTYTAARRGVRNGVSLVTEWAISRIKVELLAQKSSRQEHFVQFTRVGFMYSPQLTWIITTGNQNGSCSLTMTSTHHEVFKL